MSVETLPWPQELPDEIWCLWDGEDWVYSGVMTSRLAFFSQAEAEDAAIKIGEEDSELITPVRVK